MITRCTCILSLLAVLPASSTTSLSGVSVTFDGTPAKLLYVSSSQVNVAVPFDVGAKSSVAMQVTVNGVPGPARSLPLTATAPSLFANLTSDFQNCTAHPGVVVPAFFVPVARNQDGTLNSCEHPAGHGKVVSFFLNGMGGQLSGNGDYVPWLGSIIPVVAQVGKWSAEVVDVALDNDFVWRFNVRVPQEVVPSGIALADVTLSINLFTGPVPVGPLQVSSLLGGPSVAQPQTMRIWVGPESAGHFLARTIRLTCL
ncbi:MAG: hypothetical protein LAP38_08230 [Acidobacteriia bacterium]|nr:hypothetical protein [Terriglobia bacterium]